MAAKSRIGFLSQRENENPHRERPEIERVEPKGERREYERESSRRKTGETRERDE